mmetsp:Transcript_7433/g.10985  ORF Transcript_7433/g.10985 Transcript_7433/m.10985 type:complete len:614 (-) Transcript_7433:1611-3452(-)
MRIIKENTGPLDIRNLKRAYKEDFENVLSCNGSKEKKILFMDAEVGESLIALFEGKTLQNFNVERQKVLTPLKESQLIDRVSDMANIIYIITPNIKQIKIVAHQIDTLKKVRHPAQIFLYLLPRKTLICDRILKDSGIQVDRDLEIYGEFPLDLVPFDDDIISMLLPYTIKECKLDGDLQSLSFITRAIMKLQHFYGPILNLVAKGDYSFAVAQMLKRQQSIANEEIQNTKTPTIHTIMLIDRSVDWITPLLTQQTYEGLLDEIYGILHSFFVTPFFCKPDQRNKHEHVQLNSTDVIFEGIRDLNQSHFKPIILEQTAAVDKLIKEKNNIEDAKKLKAYVQKTKYIKRAKENLEMHLNLIQDINVKTNRREFKKMIDTEHNLLNHTNQSACIKYIEECIFKQEPVEKVLRLLSLMSILQGGIPDKKYDYFRKEIVQSYGFELVLTLNNLEKMGLLYRKGFTANWKKSFANWKKLCGLLNTMDGSDPKDPYDIHNVYNGIAPISVSIIQRLSQKLDDPEVLRFPGKTIAFPLTDWDQSNLSKRVCLVFYVGGCTLAEISAIRYLNKKLKEDAEKRAFGNPQKQVAYDEYVIATTHIINGETFMRSCHERVGKYI